MVDRDFITFTELGREVRHEGRQIRINEVVEATAILERHDFGVRESYPELKSLKSRTLDQLGVLNSEVDRAIHPYEQFDRTAWPNDVRAVLTNESCQLVSMYLGGTTSKLWCFYCGSTHKAVQARDVFGGHYHGAMAAIMVAVNANDPNKVEAILDKLRRHVEERKLSKYYYDLALKVQSEGWITAIKWEEYGIMVCTNLGFKVTCWCVGRSQLEMSWLKAINARLQPYGLPDESFCSVNVTGNDHQFVVKPAVRPPEVFYTGKVRFDEIGLGAYEESYEAGLPGYRESLYRFSEPATLF